MGELYRIGVDQVDSQEVTYLLQLQAAVKSFHDFLAMKYKLQSGDTVENDGTIVRLANIGRELELGNRNP